MRRRCRTRTANTWPTRLRSALHGCGHARRNEKASASVIGPAPRTIGRCSLGAHKREEDSRRSRIRRTRSGHGLGTVYPSRTGSNELIGVSQGRFLPEDRRSRKIDTVGVLRSPLRPPGPAFVQATDRPFCCIIVPAIGIPRSGVVASNHKRVHCLMRTPSATLAMMRAVAGSGSLRRRSS